MLKTNPIITLQGSNKNYLVESIIISLPGAAIVIIGNGIGALLDTSFIILWFLVVIGIVITLLQVWQLLIIQPE